jgi:DNA segregation ATPase FtsK/SpoIIIE, S-DNA-T family
VAHILPFKRRSGDQTADPVMVDVDGDGKPDAVTPARPAENPSFPPELSGVLAELPDDVVLTAHAPGQHMPQSRPDPVEGDRRPIVSPWMKSRGGWQAGARWWLGRKWYSARFHGAHLPVYACRVGYRAPRGLIRLLMLLTRWALDVRADAMEQALATGTKQDAEQFRRLREDRAFRIRSRLIVLGICALTLVIGAAVLANTAPWPAQGAVVIGVVAVLAAIGSDRGKPLVGRAMLITAKYRELTDVVLYRALRAAGLGGQPAKYDKEGREVAEDTRATLAGLISRTANNRGSEALVDLPFGSTAADATAALDKIASGLDAGSEQLFITPVAGKQRRIKLVLLDEDPMLLPPHVSPLAKMPRVSVWDDHPFARTPLGDVVATSLLFRSFLLGAVPRMGKSYAAKCLVAPAVLDPFCDLTLIDLKGGRDWRAGEAIAVDLVTGDEDEDLLRALAVLEKCRSEARARFKEFGQLSTEEMPEDKLTRALAEAGMRPHVIVVDELQNATRASDKEIRRAALDLLVWLAKTAPAAGYSLVSITQRPGADVVPSDLREQYAVRMALRTKTRQGSDSILGSDISATGYRSDRFSEAHKGAVVIGGIPAIGGGDLQYARTDLFTPSHFSAACAAGRQRRIDAGTLRGLAAGQEDEVVVTVHVVDDVHVVWPGDQSKVWSSELVTRLREVFPRRYAALTEVRLAQALKPHHMTPSQVKLDGQNRQGYALDDLRRARRALAATRPDDPAEIESGE